MNRYDRRRAAKQGKKVVNMKGAGEITAEMEFSFKAWLDYSNITEEIFLNYAEVRPFTILKQMQDGVLSLSIGTTNSKNVFMRYGEPFMSPSKEENRNFMLNAGFILLFVAAKLDRAFLNNPQYPERRETDCNYFDNQVKAFVKDNISSR